MQEQESFNNIKGNQESSADKQYWKDEENAIKQRTAEHKAGYEAIFAEQDKLHQAIAGDIDDEIKQREEASRRFSAQLKENMQTQASFNKKFGTEITAGISSGNTENEIKQAIQTIDGFENANTRALKSVQDGATTLQQYAVSINTTDGNFKNYVLSIDKMTNKHYLLEKGISAVDSAAGRLGEQTKFLSKFGKELEGIKLPTNAGEVELTSSIRTIDGFENAYVKAIGSVTHGNQELQQAYVVTENAAGGFNTFKFSIDQVTGSTHVLEKGLRSFNVATDKTIDAINGISSALVSLGIVKGLKEASKLVWECVDASTSFETSLTDILKTTSFSVDEMKVLKNEIMALSTTIPEDATGLSSVAEIGGQLNMPKDEIINFTTLMSHLGNTTSLTSEAAADFVARFSNITQMDTSKWTSFSSSLVELGNNFAGTETEIAKMSLRLASAGKQANMTESEILGLSAGLNAVGLTEELAGTAMSKMINKINIAVSTGKDNLEDFARIAGVSAKEFADMFNNNASNALMIRVSKPA